MLNRIVSLSLRFRGVLLALVLACAGYGVYALSRAKYDVFPEFAPPQVAIQAEAPGLAPEQVEVLVTQPIENVLNGVAGIESLRSESIQGLSVVTVTFGSGADIYLDRQVIAERLTGLTGQLPQGVQSPVMVPLTSSTGDLMTIGLTSTQHSLMELRTIADWQLKPRLLAVPGIAKVAVFGGEVKQLQIQVHPEQLIRYDLSLDEVLAAARRATGVRGGGAVDTANQRVILHTEGQAVSPQALGETALIQQTSGAVTATLRLSDVATVVEAPEPPISAAVIMGQPGVILNLWAQYGANTLEVSRLVDQALGEVAPSLSAQGIVMSPDLFKPATFIEASVRNVEVSLLIGAVLVMAVLFLFLFDIRTAAISCTAIPLSLLAAVSVLGRFGHTLNTMTLGGLAIAIGEVVDDAVIDVENIQRRLRENRRRPVPLPPLRVVLEASLEVRSAVVYATFAVVIVFLPILMLSGLAGRLFAPLGIAYILAILASLLVALTATPALCSLLLSGRELERPESPFAIWLRARYRGLLLRVERSSRTVFSLVAAAAVAGLVALHFLGGGFIPELREGHFLVHMAAVPGTSLTESVRIGRQVSEALLRLPSVRAVAQRVGRAEADDTFGTHSSEFEVDLRPLTGAQATSARSDVRHTLESFPGVTFEVNTFLAERVEETFSGYTASVIVNLFGDDLDALDRQAQAIAAVLRRTRGAADVRVQSPPGTPQLMIQLHPEALARWGFDPVEVLDAVRTAYQGEVVGQVYQGNQIFNAAVMLSPDDRRNPERVGALPLRSPAGVYVRLRQLCDIRETSGRYVVLHEGARRVQAITCNVEGRDVESFVREAKQHLGAVLPPGMYVEWTGAAAVQSRSKQDLLVHSLLALVGIVGLLSIVMGSGRNLLLVLANLPFALVGGVLAVFLSGGTLSFGSMVGFVTLFGITLRNSIMMISHYEHLVDVEGAVWGPDTALRGASERCVPILMTALVTALGLLPIAVGSGAPGREIEGPMALVILGGLVTSTILNLLVLPTLALRYGRFGGARTAADALR